MSTLLVLFILLVSRSKAVLNHFDDMETEDFNFTQILNDEVMEYIRHEFLDDVCQILKKENDSNNIIYDLLIKFHKINELEKKNGLLQCTLFLFVMTIAAFHFFLIYSA